MRKKAPANQIVGASSLVSVEQRKLACVFRLRLFLQLGGRHTEVGEEGLVADAIDRPHAASPDGGIAPALVAGLVLRQHDIADGLDPLLGRFVTFLPAHVSIPV